MKESLNVRQARVFLPLENVTRVSSDALLLMRAIVDHARGTYRNFGGTLPLDPVVAAKFKQSGFFAGFANPPKEMPPPQGMIRRKSNIFVASEIAGDLVQFAISHANLSHGVADASYKNLVELMGNTHNHAAGRREKGHGDEGHRERWHASVYCQDGVAYFTFVDLGVGILRSAAPRNFLRALGATLFDYGQPKLLRDTFSGIIGASADIPGRGFGLIRMQEAAETEMLPDLRVLTLSVTGEVAGMKFRTSTPNYRGTIFRWTTRQSMSEL